MLEKARDGVYILLKATFVQRSDDLQQRIQGGEATEDEPPDLKVPPLDHSAAQTDQTKKEKTDQASVPELNIQAVRFRDGGEVRYPSPYPPGHGRDTDQWKTAVGEFLALGDKELGDQHKCPNTQA